MPTADELRPLLLAAEQAEAMDAPGSTDAAVLVPLFERDGRIFTLFTERRDDLRRHAGEISFPGGRQDPGESLETTALREADEEIGLDPGAVEVVGSLPPVGTFVTSYRVFPFVGLIDDGHTWAPQATEVANILEFAVADLVAGYESKRLVRKGVPIKTPTFTVGDTLVWGATARMVQHLTERLEPLL